MMNNKVEYKDTTIAYALNKVAKNKYLIPSLQRKYVWQETQIYSLLDSIMQDYPFGTFLFWNIKKHEKKNRDSNKFYQFLDTFDNSGNGSGKKQIISNQDVTCVIDGQQRFTSLYLAFYGIMRTKNKQGSTEDKSIYIDINHIAEEDAQEHYKFRFLSETEVDNSYNKIVNNKQIKSDAHIWIKLGELTTNEDYSLNKKEFESEAVKSRTARSKTNKQKLFVSNQIQHIKKKLAAIDTDGVDDIFNKEIIERWKKVLERIFFKTHVDSPISYFTIQNMNLEQIIEIFIRQNSAGTPLSKTQMLMSVLSSKWVNARDEVDILLDDINRNGTFDFDIDFVMRSALYINDLNILVNRKNVIKYADTLQEAQNWKKVTNALNRTAEYLDDLGFSKNTLSSNNAVIPIAYYLSKQKDCKIPTVKKSSTFEQFKFYLFSVMALKVFGNHGDTVLQHIRDSLKDILDQEFNFKLLNNAYEKHNKGWQQKPLMFKKKSQLDSLLDAKYGKEAYTVLGIIALSETFPIDLQKSIHVDHIFPRNGSGYPTNEGIGKIDKSSNEWQLLNSISNLVFLQESDNILKSAIEPKKFYENNMTPQIERILKKNIFFDTRVDINLLSYNHYKSFLEKRRKLIKNKLISIFKL